MGDPNANSWDCPACGRRHPPERCEVWTDALVVIVVGAALLLTVAVSYAAAFLTRCF